MKYIKPINEHFDHLPKDEIIDRLERLLTIAYMQLRDELIYSNVNQLLLDEGIKSSEFIKVNDEGWAIEGYYYTMKEGEDEPAYLYDRKELKHFDKDILAKILEFLGKEEKFSRILNQEMFKKLNK